MATLTLPVLHDTLTAEWGACPPGCHACVDACADHRAVPRIATLDLPLVSFHGAVVCGQCGEPACRDACPTGAITREETGVVRLDEGRCVGCGACAVACAWGGITLDPQSGRAAKCDTCAGRPACAAACPTGTLRWVETSGLLRHFGHPDPFTKGVSLCPGCAAELGFRMAFRVIGSDAVVFAAPGCACMLACGLGTAATTRLPSVMSLMTNVPSLMTGVARQLKRSGARTRCVAFAGDGTTADVGFQPLSGAAERGEHIVYICYDNEGYMNTGVQRSSTTLQGARTMTTPVGPGRAGKPQAPKDVAVLMAMHATAYVATASVSHPEDFAIKLQRALAVEDGLAYIHLYAPCHVGWQAPMDSALEIARLAVETRVFPLWEARRGRFRLTHPIPRPRPLEDFAGLMGRLRHLGPAGLETLGRTVEERYRRVEALCSALPWEAPGADDEP